MFLLVMECKVFPFRKIKQGNIKQIQTKMFEEENCGIMWCKKCNTDWSEIASSNISKMLSIKNSAFHMLVLPSRSILVKNCIMKEISKYDDFGRFWI